MAQKNVSGTRRDAEKKQIAASYILTYFNEIQLVTHHYANYLQLVLELESQFKGHIDNLPPDQKDFLRAACSTIRYHATTSYIAYCAVSRALDLKIESKITTAYEKIKTALIVKRDHLEEYVTLQNAKLVSTVIGNLLQTSQVFVDKLYGAPQETQETTQK